MSETEQPRRYSIAVDCDGVIHSYTSGWQGADQLPDPPVDGAIDFLHAVLADYDLVVLTTRAREAGGAEAVEAYLREHGFVGDVLVTAEKVPALWYVDDRGWRFNGTFPTMNQLRHMKPWRVGDPQRTTAATRLRERGQHLKKLQDRQQEVKRELRDANRILEEARGHAEALLGSFTAEALVDFPDLQALVRVLLPPARPTEATSQ